MTLNSYNLVYQVGINQIRNHSPSLHAFANVSPCRLGNRDCVPTQRQTAGSLDAPGCFQLSRAFFLHALCPFWVSSLMPVAISGKLFGKEKPAAVLPSNHFLLHHGVRTAWKNFSVNSSFQLHWKQWQWVSETWGRDSPSPLNELRHWG